MDKTIEEAVNLLKKHYAETKEYVKDSVLYSDYADEKIYHSMQVVGAMKYIMKHEDTFKNRDEEFLRMAKLATTLHDIGRFEEIKRLYDLEKGNISSDDLWTTKLNHGMMGYEILKNTKYNDLRILIPIKHHGDMIEDLYADEQFSSIKDKKLQREIVEIIFLVRDADKTANYYLMSGQGKKKFSQVFAESDKEEDFGVSTDSLEDFTAFQIVSKERTRNRADRWLNLLSWVFDMNYVPSFNLIVKNNSLNKMIDGFNRYEKDNQIRSLVENTIADYLKIRYDEKIRTM